MKIFKSILLTSALLLLVSCRLKAKNENNLTNKDLQFIRDLSILDSNETILLLNRMAVYQA